MALFAYDIAYVVTNIPTQDYDRPARLEVGHYDKVPRSEKSNSFPRDYGLVKCRGTFLECCPRWGRWRGGM